MDVLGGIAMEGSAGYFFVEAGACEAPGGVGMEERVGDFDVDRVSRAVRERDVSAGAQSREEQPEASDRHCEGVEVNTSDSFEGPPGEFAPVDARLLVAPAFEEATEGAKEEVARSTGRVDERRLSQSE